jgi:hypothetical protein
MQESFLEKHGTDRLHYTYYWSVGNMFLSLSSLAPAARQWRADRCCMQNAA